MPDSVPASVVLYANAAYGLSLTPQSEATSKALCADPTPRAFLPHRCIAYRIWDERERYRPFLCGVDVGNVQRIEAVQHLLVRVAEFVAATAGNDGVCGVDRSDEWNAAGCFRTVVAEFQNVAF